MLASLPGFCPSNAVRQLHPGSHRGAEGNPTLFLIDASRKPLSDGEFNSPIVSRRYRRIEVIRDFEWLYCVQRSGWCRHIITRGALPRNAPGTEAAPLAP